jgi:hypothetical protein
MKALPMSTRTCGDCKVCCISFGLLPHPPWWDEYKPVGTPCKYLCEKGCSIHDQPRPDICGGFKCAYLLGLVPSPPIESGLMFTANPLEYFAEATGYYDYFSGVGMFIIESEPEAIFRTTSKQVRYWFRKRRWDKFVVLPYGFDQNPHLLPSQGKAHYRMADSVCVGWRDDPSYADKVIAWWEMN